MEGWIKVAESLAELDFRNGVAAADANGKAICIGIFRDEAFAFAHKCPHAGGFLAEGYVDALGNVVCPVHRYKFCMANGRNVSGEGYFLKRWPLRVSEEGVFVQL
ncbi:Rieske (2Fe-2S) protein [Flavihumibacter petaseus]|uniref:Putative Rieske iron-sulfur protein n=1 Tax=Flavihumibacter petaseus NBRC 106054 TaxID=1220578 RepID=A0A0E9MYS8_9BACT|nr:Rieske 2Fe-2S domain-containing protein [Flavihumibacter petaseus]GAO42764.1 putative Rieske iron-sulfur protein [Flavihumibacter petaseus NBRC 106054]